MSELAINGGTPIHNKPFHGWPVHSQKDLNNLYKILESGYYGINGEQNKLFAKRIADYSDTKYAIPVANGTVSIELILRGLGLGRGDEVILPAYTFIASISALIYAGVTPVFADIDPGTYNLSAESVEKKITPRTKAIMPVYIGGRPADMDALCALSEKYDLYLIGDAAQAIGSQWKGKNIGAYGIAASFSCQNSKNLTCGEGGIITTDDDALYNEIITILNGGRNAKGEHSHIGLNNNMSEWQAGILNTQLDKLDGEIKTRMDNAEYLDSLISKLPFVSPLIKDGRITSNSYHLYLLNIHEDKLNGVSRERFLKAVNAEGVPLSAGYSPLYDFPCIVSDYAKKCIGSEININPGIENTEYFSRHEGCWLYHAVMLGDHSDMDDIASALVKVYGHLYDLR